ncbi:MAG: energy transducer TonB [Bacteroidales bacterium]|nr:energy transducer TonB [Bacteroidales bacterium]
MKSYLSFLLLFVAFPAFAQWNKNSQNGIIEITVKAIVEAGKYNSDIDLYRFRVSASFLETYDKEALIFTVEDKGYIIPVRLQKNDLNAVNRFQARNLQKGDILILEGMVDRISLNDEEYRGLVDAVIVDDDDSTNQDEWTNQDEMAYHVEGTPNAHLKGRIVLGTLPRPSYAAQKDGKVVVSIWVDQYGNVKKAVPGASGTTVTDKDLWDAARKAAMESHFNSSDDAPSLQEGTITYLFKPAVR